MTMAADYHVNLSHEQAVPLHHPRPDGRETLTVHNTGDRARVHRRSRL
jgi:hypothetical protein